MRMAGRKVRKMNKGFWGSVIESTSRPMGQTCHQEEDLVEDNLMI